MSEPNLNFPGEGRFLPTFPTLAVQPGKFRFSPKVSLCPYQFLPALTFLALNQFPIFENRNVEKRGKNNLLLAHVLQQKLV